MEFEMESATQAQNGEMNAEDKMDEDQKVSTQMSSYDDDFEMDSSGFVGIGTGGYAKNDLMEKQIIDSIGKFGSEEILQWLRAASRACYKKLNPIYWDIVNPRIEVIATYPARIGVIVSEPMPPLDIHIFKHREEKIKSFEEITRDIWTSKIAPIAHIFRTLELSNIVDPNIKYEDLKWTDVISLMSPYITCLELGTIDAEYESEQTLTAEQLVEFMKQFTKLKKLKISNCGDGVELNRSETRIIGYTDPHKLKVMLQSLKPNIETVVKVRQNYKTVFDICGDIPGINWTVKMDGGKMEEILPPFRNRPDLNVKFNITPEGCRNLDDLRTVAQYGAEFQDKIFKLALWINLKQFANQDKDAVQNCLETLSPIVTELELDMDTKNWNIENETWSWTKLKRFQVTCSYNNSPRGNIHFAILKTCSNLKCLTLDGDQSSFIFRNRSKTDKQNIQGFFGGGVLSKLESLHIHNGKIREGNRLEAYLMELLPKLDIDYYRENKKCRRV